MENVNQVVENIKSGKANLKLLDDRVTKNNKLEVCF